MKVTIVLTSPIHLLRKKLKGIEKLMEYNHEINVFDMLLFDKCVILNAYDIPRRQRETIPSEMVTQLQTDKTQTKNEKKVKQLQSEVEMKSVSLPYC